MQVVHDNVRNYSNVDWSAVSLYSLHWLKEFWNHYVAFLRVGKQELVVDFLVGIAWHRAWHIGDAQPTTTHLANECQANRPVQTRHSTPVLFLHFCFIVFKGWRFWSTSYHFIGGKKVGMEDDWGTNWIFIKTFSVAHLSVKSSQ